MTGSGSELTLRCASRSVLTLFSAVHLAACSPSKPVTCALGDAPKVAVGPGAAAFAEVFWDNSGSMRDFYVKQGPYARLGERMEARILADAGVFKSEHAYVAEGLQRSDDFLEPNFSGDYTDLLTAAQEMAVATQDPSRGIAVLISDLLVVTSPAQRASTEEVCGTTLPTEPKTPKHFAKCFEFGLAKGSASSMFASVVRIPSGGKAMYALVTARSPDVGRPVVEQILAATAAWAPSELRLVDTTGSDGLVAEATCISDSEDPVYMGGRAPSGVPTCEFRFRSTPSHHLKCTTTPRSAGSGLIQMRPAEVVVNGVASPLSDSGEFGLDIAKVVSDNAAVDVRTAFVSPANTSITSTIHHFVSGGADPALPLTAEEEDVAAVIGGLVPVLTSLTPPESHAWIVAYQ